MADPRRRTSRDPSRRSHGGFTLIELVVAISLLALLAGAAAPLAMQQVRSSRLRTTQERMESLVIAMVGDPKRGDYGYVGDIGALPAALVDLNTRDEVTIDGAIVDPNDGISTGWAGPYVPFAATGNTAFVDAWGNPFVYVQSDGAQVASNGPDGQPATGDELIFPAAPPDTGGSLTVVVEGVANDNPANTCRLDGTDATVEVSTATNGTRVPVFFVDSSPAGTFVNQGSPNPDELHNGFHGILVTGQGDWAGASVRGVGEVNRTTSVVSFRLHQPAGAPVGCP